MGYDKSKQTWFGIGIPASADYGDENFAVVEQISKYVYEGVDYLLVAGAFYFNSGGNTIINIGLYNLQTSTWTPLLGNYYRDGISSVVANETGTLFLAGDFYSQDSSFATYQLGAGTGMQYYGNVGHAFDLLLLDDTFYLSGFFYFPSYTQNDINLLVHSPASEIPPQWTFAASQSMLPDFLLGNAFLSYPSNQ